MSFCLLVAAAGAFPQDLGSGRHPLDGLTPSWLQLGGQVRGRLEAPWNAGSQAGRSGPYLLTRIRLQMAIRPSRWLRFFVEAQDTRALGYGAQAPAAMNDPADLRAGYIEIGPDGCRGFTARAGRQEIALGSTRLIAIGPWSNTSRSFDALRVAYAHPGVRFELIAGSVVQADGRRLDRHKPGEHFYASYNTFSSLIPHVQVEPYFIAKTILRTSGELGSAGDAAVYTAGARWLGTSTGRFEYSAEMIGQWGRYAADTVRASAGTYALGWKISDSTRKPRLSADYSFGSGDRNPADGRRGTLDLVYGSNQPFFSYSGMFSWRNTRIVRAGLDFMADKVTRIGIDYRDFRLATVADGWYDCGGSPILLNRTATSGHIGQGPDLQLVRTTGRYGQVTIGVTGVFAGSYLRQSGRGGFVSPYVMWARSF